MGQPLLALLANGRFSCSPVPPWHWLGLHGKHQTESYATQRGIRVSEARVKLGGKRKTVSSTALTGEDEDEEGADASDHADDFTDVWDKHGNDQRGDEPQDCQSVAAAALQLRRRPAIAPSPAAE